jgi:hypothetical protein
MEFTRINNDINGNPRYVVHFYELINDNDYEIAETKKDIANGITKTSELYKIATKKAKKIGGKKYHNKSYGGGIVFQSYNVADLEKDIIELKNKQQPFITIKTN